MSNLDNEMDQLTPANTVQNRFVATSFTTGSEDTILQSMVTRLVRFGGGNEFVRIHNDHQTLNQPGSEAISFLENPVDLLTDDRFQFTPNGTHTLSADTTYWMVFGATGDGEFSPYFTLSFAQTGSTGWSIGDTVTSSVDGGNTWPSSENVAYQFQITSIIPETSNYVLIGGICLIAFAMFRRIRISQTS